MEIKNFKYALPKEGFSDIRYQEYKNTLIKGTKEKIDEVSMIRKNGGNVRVLKGGGFGNYAFTDPADVEMAFREATIASELNPGKETLKRVEFHREHIRVSPEKDPRSISVKEKKDLLQKYIDLIMDNSKIVDLESQYYEQFTDTIILNNQGTEIRQEELICGMSFRMTSKEGTLTQMTRLSFGGTESFDELLNKEQEVKEKVKQTVDLLHAKTISGGNYDVILDSDVGGLFIHEAFGHLSESDNLIGNQTLAETMELGTKFAMKDFNVIDDPTKKGHPGSYVFDHEGTKAKKVSLITDGNLTGRLHSLESASYMDEDPTGHARAKNFGFTPIVRMGNIYIDKGTSTLEQMIQSIDDGLYLFGSAGGQTSGETFTFAVQGGYRIENGRITDMVRDISLTGHLFTTLKNIEMVGNYVEFSKAGGCGKAGQILIQSGKGSAPIKIKNMGIGGQ